MAPAVAAAEPEPEAVAAEPEPEAVAAEPEAAAQPEPVEAKPDPVPVEEEEEEEDETPVVVEDSREHLNIVFIGHVDAGKSTIGGHLMYGCAHSTGQSPRRCLLRPCGARACDGLCAPVCAVLGVLATMMVARPVCWVGNPRCEHHPPSPPAANIWPWLILSWLLFYS